MDVVYIFIVLVMGGYNIYLDLMFDGVLYVVMDCVDIENMCVGVVENVGSNNIEEMLIMLEVGIMYFIVVDGYSSFLDNSGLYILMVDLCILVCMVSDGFVMICGDD